MLTDSEINRIRKRAEHIIMIGKRQYAKDSILYAVLLGDALDIVHLLDEIDLLRQHLRSTRQSDFKLVSKAEIDVLLSTKKEDEQ